MIFEVVSVASDLKVILLQRRSINKWLYTHNANKNRTARRGTKASLTYQDDNS